MRLQLNTNQSGMLEHYGYALRTLPLRAHSGDVVLFTPNNAGAFVVKVRARAASANDDVR